MIASYKFNTASIVLLININGYVDSFHQTIDSQSVNLHFFMKSFRERLWMYVISSIV